MEELKSQHLFQIHDGEQEFFEGFLTTHGIAWASEEKRAGILTLSKSYVGYIHTPKRIIRLEPKYAEIKFEHILRIYHYVYAYNRSDSDSSLDLRNQHSSTDIVDAFLESVAECIHLGIHTSYKSQSLFSRNVRGSLDIVQSFLRFSQRQDKPVATRASLLSLDTEINALLVGALWKLRKTADYGFQALQLLAYFEGVQGTVENAAQVLSKLNFNNQTQRFKKPLVYAVMIIDQLDAGATGNTLGTESFILNFDRLFEDFVAKVLTELPEQRVFSTWKTPQVFGEARLKSSLSSTSGQRTYLPDILHRYIDEDEENSLRSSANVVLDVKNKAYSPFKNADLYQLFTYIKLLNSRGGILLYPSFAEREPELFILNNQDDLDFGIGACFINIADEKGTAFTQSINNFLRNVEELIATFNE